jgi:hypothetical protein
MEMTIPAAWAEIRVVSIDERRRIVLAPSVEVAVSGSSAEVKGLLHIVVTFAGESTVHYYTVPVESWTVETRAEELRRKIERALTKANEKAAEYAEAIQTLKELGVELGFRGGVAARSWLPEWLQKHLPP